MTETARRAYAAAGVSVEAADKAVGMIRDRLSRSPLDLLKGIGGFGAALALPDGYRQPVLVAATDGVGTKAEIARSVGRLETIGQDLVAMCADDVVCHGAQPTFFLDYVSVGHLQPERVARLVGGIAAACEAIGCDLVGGETAEHPGVMEPDAFDLAGFCVGIVERDQLLDGSSAREGDVVLGLASSGLHANGFSLVRALVARHGLDLAEEYAALLDRYGLDEAADDVIGSLGDELLTPTRLYAVAVLALRDEMSRQGLRLGGLAHVTGGGLAGNLPRAVPENLGVALQVGSWVQHPIFDLMARLGGLDGPELRATFNCGIGMAAVVEPAAVDMAIALLRGHEIQAWIVGEVRLAAELGPGRYRERE